MIGRLGAGAAAALLTAYLAPAGTARPPLRHLTPALAGRGRPGGVALTFDDGPDEKGTPAVLAALAEQGWTATFFLLGHQTRRRPDLARAVVAAGHEIAVHGDEHHNHLGRGPRWVIRDLIRATETITTATGVRPRWFRPPYGVLTGASLCAARRARLRPVLWTGWGRDWETRTPSQVIDVLRPSVRSGATLLLHDGRGTGMPGSWRSTVAVLPLLAEEVDRRRLAVRSLGEHLSRPW